MAKKCPPGKYYCFDDKKCKKIPRGYRIGARGYLARDTKDDDSETKKNGNGSSNGNGNGGNGSGNGNGGSGGNGGGNGGGGMGESIVYEKLDSNDKPFVKKLVGKLRKGSKTHAKQADDLEKAMTENQILVFQENQANQQDQKNIQTYIQMKILKELFMDLVSRTLLKQKRLYQKSGILLDRMLIRFKRLLLWNKGRERWVKPLRQQSTESTSIR